MRGDLRWKMVTGIQFIYWEKLGLFGGKTSDLSRAIARLKGDRSPFNTSPSDLPEIASDFRSGGAAPQIFDLSCQRFSAKRKTWKPKGFPTLNLQGSFFHSGRQAPWREKSPARGVHAAAYD
jgi:hypothetical protein